MYKLYVCVCLLSVVVYLNTLRAGFVYDDNRAIIANQDIKTTTPLINILSNDFWGTPLSSSNSHGSYRPLCVLTFRLNYWAWGLRPLGYHLVNIILHSIATGLVLHAGSLLLPGKCPVTAAAVFAVHPIHTEAVAGIVGRADVLACVFFLLSFIMYDRHVQIRTTAYQKQIKRYTNVPNLSPEAKVEYLLTIFSVHNLFNVCKIRRKREHFCQHFIMNKTDIFLNVYLILSVCFSICSTLCKETGITVLGVCIVYEVLLRARCDKKISSAAVSLFTIATTTLLLLFLRLHLTGLKPPAFSSADNPTSHDTSLLTRTLSFLYLPLINFHLLLYPKLLSFDWSMDAVPRIHTLFDVRNILTLSFYVVLYQMIKCSYCKILKKTREKTIINKHKIKCLQCNQNLNTVHTTTCRLKNNNNTPVTCSCINIARTKFDIHQCLLMCIAFMVLPFLPASNLPFYVGFVVAERVLYLPSVGYCFLFALGLNCFCQKVNKRLYFAILCFLLAIHAVRTVQRNEDWRDEESLYRSGIPVNPPKAYGNLGSILSSQGRLEEAEEAFRLALLYRPNMADVHYNLGNLQAGLKRYSDAIHSYEMAIKFRPSLAVSYLNLGHLLATVGRYTEAEKVLLKCTKLEAVGLKDVNAHQSAQASAFLHLSRIYFEKGNVQEAVEVYRHAVNMRTDQELQEMQDRFLMDSPSNLGLNEETNKWIKATIDPNPIPAYLTYGKLLMKNRTKAQEVDYWFQRAPVLILKDPMVYMHYGKYLVDNGRYKEAVRIYLEASQLRIDQYNVVTSAAAVFRHRGRYDEAEVFYRKAVYIKPSDSTSHSNLGAILHLKGNCKEEESGYKEAESSYQEAESSYREALKLNSKDETALVNLSKLRNWIKRNNI